jgi:hypothetical protein
MATDWKKIMHRAMMGDEDAIAAVATRLDLGPTEEDTREHDDFIDAVARFQDQFADLHKDPAARKRAVELDAVLAKRYPKLGYQERLNIVGNAVRSGQSSVETGLDATRSDTIRQMRESRMPRIAERATAQRASSSPDDDDETSISRRQQHWR